MTATLDSAKPHDVLLSGSGITWAICKSAPRSRQPTTPAPHRSVFYTPDAFPAAQPTVSKHWRQARMYVLFCSLAVLDPRVGHTMDLLSPFIPVLCHSDWLFHGESCPRLDVVHPCSAWPSSYRLACIMAVKKRRRVCEWVSTYWKFGVDDDDTRLAWHDVVARDRLQQLTTGHARQPWPSCPHSHHVSVEEWLARPVVRPLRPWHGLINRMWLPISVRE